MPPRRRAPINLRKILPRPPDAPCVPEISQTGLYYPDRSLENGVSCYDNSAPASSQDPFDIHQHSGLPSPISHNSQPTSDDNSQYSEGDEDDEDEDCVMSDEEPIAMKQLETTHEPRKRRYKPAFQSKLSKRREAVPGRPGHNHGKKGKVQIDVFGVLEYWRTDRKMWIPAVYHHQIREKLIQKANTSNAAVYTHPRERGVDHLDITSFLQSQRHWDLERDNGWTGVEFFFEFKRVNFQRPNYKVPWMYDEKSVILDTDNHPVKDYRDIPLTLSSEVEGGLMEAIRHVDPRITWGDFWARLPEKWRKGGKFKYNALSLRASRFRLVNCIPARTERKGSKELRAFIFSLMSPAARAANSTRELSKLSDEQQKQAQELNKGKHNANAGGYDIKLNDARRRGLAPRRAGKAVAKKRKPASSQSRKNTSPQLTPELNSHEDTERQLSCFAPDQGHANQCRNPHRSTPIPLYTSPDSLSGASYGNAPLDPLLHNDIANHDFDPFASSSGTYENMPMDPAVAAPNSYIPRLDAWEGSLSNRADLSVLSPFGKIYYRHIPPLTPEDAQSNFHARAMSDWPPTTTAYQSYMF